MTSATCRQTYPTAAVSAGRRVSVVEFTTRIGQELPKTPITDCSGAESSKQLYHLPRLKRLATSCADTQILAPTGRVCEDGFDTSEQTGDHVE